MPHEERWVFRAAAFGAPFRERAAFEEAKVRFVDAGFPDAESFQ